MREFWQELAGEVDGGATVAEVARRHRVQPGTLSWGRWKPKKTAPAPAPMLLPVVVRPVVAGAPVTSSIELQVDDLIIRVPAGTDVSYVAKLVDALRDPSWKLTSKPMRSTEDLHRAKSATNTGTPCGIIARPRAP